MPAAKMKGQKRSMQTHPWWRAVVATTLLMAFSLTPIGATPVATPVADQADNAIVETDAGPVRGVVTAEARFFQAIPFAAPPVGDLRWQSPQPVTPWTAVRDATAPGNRCAQTGDAFNGPASDAEDCLYLNLTVPRSADAGHLKPVMVWVHGGGFIGGAGSDQDATRLAVTGDVVVVTVNYRLGIFGFFGHPALAGSAGFGLEDQQAALQWVQGNVAAFGGDPGNVTLFGESGGGTSICAHLTSPPAAGLFHQAILQSGGCLGDWPAGTLPGVPALPAWAPAAEVAAIGAAAAADVGCGDAATALACLRQLAVTDLLPGNLFFSRPAFGTPVLPADPARELRAGRFHQVPILSGHTQDEGTFWAAFQPQPITADSYRALLDGAFGEQATRVVERYPVDAYATPGLAWSAVVGDRVWACPTLDGHRLFAARTPAYVYRFDDREAPVIFPEPPEIPFGAYHASELTYLFDNLGFGTPGAALSPEQQQLSDQMIRYWANFAATGDPNDANLPEWPAFQPSDALPHVQSLAPGVDGIGPIDVAAEHQCEFWASLQPAS